MTAPEPIGTPVLFGILNVTQDSFSDGGKYAEPAAAIAHAKKLKQDGADVIDIGAVASNPDAATVDADIEVARLAPIIAALRGQVQLSIDTFNSRTQSWCIAQGVDWLNDIKGFADPSLYPELASSTVRLIVMHNVAPQGRAERIATDPATIFDRLFRFFDQRVTALTDAGITMDRIVLDPGMGFFLGSDPHISIHVLQHLSKLRERYNLPLLISVSRKSFVRNLAQVSVAESGPATLAAELFAVQKGANFIRTHDVAAFRQHLAVRHALAGANYG